MLILAKVVELDIIAHFTEKFIQSGGFSPNEKIIWEGTMIGIHYC
jgi:hypothetical protein